ncbi:unnamed protein product [Amoebophrya sp. A120]|nr:unnamed protein product [Amoebophrya sp. A120]|eukprot:GSA120T00018479001.1
MAVMKNMPRGSSTPGRKSDAKSADQKKTQTTKASDSIPIVGGFFLPKRQVYRALAILAALVAAVTVSGSTSGVSFTFANATAIFVQYRWPIHVFCFATWFGCSMWVSFVAGLVMFHNLPRHVFGRLQAALFPRYFQYSAIFVAACVLLDQAMPYVMPAARTSTSNQLGTTQLGNLIGILAIVLLNLLVFEPKTTAVMFARHKVEVRLGTGHEIGQLRPSDPEKANDPELVALSKKFGALHGVSTTLNLIGLCLGTWHCVWLGSRIQ